MPRYFVETPIASDQAELTGAEAHHLAHVMRARPGDEVTLFDGGGAEFAARVEQVGRSRAVLAVLSRHEVDRESPRAVTLAVALPKGDRQKWLVEKAVELGVARLVPLITRRGVAEPGAAIDRLRRAVIEASKQCGRNRLMPIGAPRAWQAFVGEGSAEASVATARTGPPGLRFIAHPGGMPVHEALAGLARQARSEPPPVRCFAIGPEGGFTDEEVSAALSAGYQAIDLGPRILRVETAALLLAGLGSAAG
jgi:16S rRNA (uracil1498-N3)-methyltransferase